MTEERLLLESGCNVHRYRVMRCGMRPLVMFSPRMVAVHEIWRAELLSDLPPDGSGHCKANASAKKITADR